MSCGVKAWSHVKVNNAQFCVFDTSEPLFPEEMNEHVSNAISPPEGGSHTVSWFLEYLTSRNVS